MTTTYLPHDDGTMSLLEMGVENNGRRTFVIAARQRYNSMADLAAAHPALCTAERLPLYCKICLHFARGFRLLAIDDPDEFRLRYAALVRHGKSASGNTPSTADFGPFDTSEIGHPQLAKDKLVFYAEDALYAVPYRVEVPWPSGSPQSVIKFLLLPQQ